MRELKVKVKTAKGRKISSTRWLARQLNDPYVKEAKQKGYRSRSAFKLMEIDKIDWAWIWQSTPFFFGSGSILFFF